MPTAEQRTKQMIENKNTYEWHFQFDDDLGNAFHEDFEILEA